MDEQFSNFESALAKIASQTDSEKTKHDKLIAREEVERSRDLLKKESLTIEEVKESMALSVGNELKQLNTEDYERVVFGKWQLRAEDHASILIEFLEQSRAFSELDIDDANEEQTEKIWKEVSRYWNNGNSLTDEEKKEFIQSQAIRKITERKMVEEHRKNLDGFFYLNRSSLGVGAKGLEFLATEQKGFKYNVPAENVPRDHMK